MAVGSDNAGLSSSLTDLMTSLAVIFILLLVASHNNEQQKLAGTQTGLENALRELDEAKKKTGVTRTEILAELQKALQSFAVQGVRAETDPRDPLGLLVIVPENLLKFAVNEDRIPPGGVEFLRSFTPELAKPICSDRFREEISAIIIEGHADSSGTDAINLPLSQKRSMAVVRESLEVLSKPIADVSAPSTLRACFLTFLSASGRGSSDPIKNPNTHIEDPERSRRVVFKIRVRSLEQRQVQEALGIHTPLQPVRTP
jgi:outer membrane protein OmpA-like peptidoglycan-associated protein